MFKVFEFKWSGTLFAPIVTGALATGGGQSYAAPLTGHHQQLICKFEHGGSEADPNVPPKILISELELVNGKSALLV